MKNFLLIFLCSLTTALIYGQTITPVGSPFQNGADMVFDYSGGPGNTTDWIGVYEIGEVPDGDPPSLTWDYISTPSGTFTLAGNLPNGDYAVHLFCCDGYDILASATFSVTGAAPASITATTFPIAGQPVTFDYTGSSGDPTDWIGIYASGALPGTDPSLMYQYVTGPEGSLTFDDPSILVPGEYEAYLFCCDVYTVYASTSFTVYEALAPSLAPVGTLNETLPLTFAFTGGTGSTSDWVGIYPHDTIPDGDPSSISYVYVNGANGEVTFDPIPELVQGTYYDAYLFCCDGYDILASYTNWTVILSDAGEVKMVKPLFTANPSPAHEVVRLVFTERVSGRVSFYNTAGQVVYRLDLDGDTQAEARGLLPGMYMAQFQGDKGSQAIKVVVE